MTEQGRVQALQAVAHHLIDVLATTDAIVTHRVEPFCDLDADDPGDEEQSVINQLRDEKRDLIAEIARLQQMVSDGGLADQVVSSFAPETWRQRSDRLTQELSATKASAADAIKHGNDMAALADEMQQAITELARAAGMHPLGRTGEWRRLAMIVKTALDRDEVRQLGQITERIVHSARRLFDDKPEPELLDWHEILTAFKDASDPVFLSISELNGRIGALRTLLGLDPGLSDDMVVKVALVKLARAERLASMVQATASATPSSVLTELLAAIAGEYTKPVHQETPS